MKYVLTLQNKTENTYTIKLVGQQGLVVFIKNVQLNQQPQVQITKGEIRRLDTV